MKLDELEDLNGLIRPDMVESFIPPSRAVDPYRHLFLAILNNAINNLTSSKKALRLEAEYWVMAGVDEDVFSFTTVCGALNLEPGYIRRGLATKYALRANPEQPRPIQMGTPRMGRPPVIPRTDSARPNRRCIHYSWKVNKSKHKCRGFPHKCYCCSECQVACRRQGLALRGRKRLMEPKRVQRKRSKGWKMPENTVIVDRSTKWGNPFVIHGDGFRMAPEVAVDCFRRLLNESGAWCPIPVHKWPVGKVPSRFTTVDDVRNELRGKDLACWCKPGDPCHADVLLEIANAGGSR